MNDTQSIDIENTIAIVGIGCRFPGGIRCSSTFWKFIAGGEDGISRTPTDRWNLRKFYHKDRRLIGKVCTEKGGFLNNIDQFDPDFFGISPKEAQYMDPQQRLLLEITWEAFEDAGIVPPSLSGSRIGVFIGLFMNDYAHLHTKQTEYELFGAHSAIGISAGIAANRISYVFNFTGPSMVIDTACSSSLVAIDLACTSIRKRESEMAVAGGVNLLIIPETTMLLSKAAMLSPDGLCKAFDAQANGYVRSEGAGIVVLKSLAKALADNDPIYALIKGSAVNQDGHSDGLTVPNRLAQEAVITQALANAKVKPKDIQYVEAHGTGTEIGDPIEASSLGNVLSVDRSIDHPCIIGSVKTNFGHTESAAGIAGFIKTALMLKHKQISPNLHFKTPNPKIPFCELKLRIPTSLEPWPKHEGFPRLAGVNSFGFGGTNAHVILQEYESIGEAYRISLPITEKANGKHEFQLIPLSAKSEKALSETIQNFLAFLKKSVDQPYSPSLKDIAYSAARHKTHHSCRMAIVVRSKEELIHKLEQNLLSENQQKPLIGKSQSEHPVKTGFVFSGMGQQWAGMGRQVIATEPVVRAVIEECNGLFSRFTKKWSLIDELNKVGEYSQIHETQIAQPCIFSLQVALAALWQSRGIVPDWIVGHSVGEIAACQVAGVLSLEDAALVVYHRSRLQQRLIGKGTMLAVALSAKEMERRMAVFESGVSIGAINSATSITLSGKLSVLKKIAEVLEKEKIFYRFLQVNVPYHSSAMDSILRELQSSLDSISPNEGLIPMVSTVTGQVIAGGSLNASYWPQNVRQPVLFAKALKHLIQNDICHFVEIGAHPVLSSSIIENLKEVSTVGHVYPSLRKKEEESFTLLNSLGQLYRNSFPVNWSVLYQSVDHTFVRLPTYPWQHQSLWTESDHSRQNRTSYPKNPLLGSRTTSSLPTWKAEFDLHQIGYLSDHQVQNQIIFPCSAYVEIAISAAAEIYGATDFQIENLEIIHPLILHENKQVTIETILETSNLFSIRSEKTSSTVEWSNHVLGSVTKNEKPVKKKKLDITEKKRASSIILTKAEIYSDTPTNEIFYGTAFKSVDRIWQSNTDALGQLDLHQSIQSDLFNYGFHPVAIDAGFQVLASLAPKGTFVPIKIETIIVYEFYRKTVWAYARIKNKTNNLISGDVILLDQDGNTVLYIENLICKNIQVDSVHDDLTKNRYSYTWQRIDPRINPIDSNHCSVLPPLNIALENFKRSFSPSELSDLLASLRDLSNDDLENICYFYFLESIQKMVKNEGLNDSVLFREKLKDQLRVCSNQQQLFEHLLDKSINKGLISINKIGAIEWNHKENMATKQQWKQLLYRFPLLFTELSLLARCGENLADIFQGSRDPLSLIFSNELSDIENLYQQSPFILHFNNLLSQCISSIVENLPEGESITMLEVGAGTGGMTSHVLPSLSGICTEYVFSDISAAFMKKAAISFQDYGFVQYKTFDLEIDPENQDFEENSFDLILASLVLHATSDLKQTLSNLKKLLKPDGYLIFIELVNTPLWIDMVFGTLKGWWVFKDLDLRPSHPIVDETAWKNILEFADFECTSLSLDSQKWDHCLIIARNKKVISEKCIGNNNQPNNGDFKLIPRKSFVILADEYGVATQLQQQLKVHNINQIVVNKGDCYRSIDANTYECREDHLADLKCLLAKVNENCPEQPIIVDFWGVDNSSNPLGYDAIDTLTKRNCLRILNIVQASMAYDWSVGPDLWLITNGVQTVGSNKNIALDQAPIWGFGRTIINEHPNLKTALVDLGKIPTKLEIDTLFTLIISNTDSNEDEFAIINDHIFVPRLKPDTHRKSITSQIEPLCPLIPNRNIEFPFPEDNQIVIKLRAFSFTELNETPESFNDGGLISIQCSGEVIKTGRNIHHFHAGDSVFGISFNFNMKYAVLECENAASLPVRFNYHEASSMPTAFIIAYYSLVELANLHDRERLLIHNATHPIGLAAIQIAESIGAEIFFQERSQERSSVLNSLNLKDVGDDLTQIQTSLGQDGPQNKTVDVVLNIYDDKNINKSAALLKAFKGRLVNISSTESSLSFHNVVDLKNSISFHNLRIKDLLTAETLKQYSLFQKTVRYIADYSCHALPLRIKESNGKYIFKPSIRSSLIGKECVAVNVPRKSTQLTDFKIKSDATYIISGGTKGFGFATASWIASQGAKHIVLIGKTGISDEKTAEEVSKMKNKGIAVVVKTLDIKNKNELASVFSEIEKEMPLIKGIVHAAMVLDIAILMHMNVLQLSNVLEPKILGAWNLHELSMPLKLDFFVLYSSLLSVLGFAGQAAYSAANCFLEALANHRHQNNLPASAILWGPIADTGYVSRSKGVKESIERTGFKSMPLNQAFNALSAVIENQFVFTGISNVDWKVTSRYLFALRRSKRLSLLMNADNHPEPFVHESHNHQSLKNSNANGNSRESIQKSLIQAIAATLGISLDKIDIKKSFDTYHFDSLLAVELGTRINELFQIELPKIKLLQPDLTIEELVKTIIAEFDKDSPDIQNLKHWLHTKNSNSKIDFLNEVVLPDDIHLKHSFSTSLNDSPNILLTGATGFLGAYLLRDLLVSTTATIYCLIHSHDEATAKNRLITNLKKYGLWNDQFNTRISIVFGNLETPKLGLNEDKWNSLASQLDVIIHSGAKLNFALPYESLKAVNVSGTIELLRLSCEKKTKPFHYISSAIVISQTMADPSSLEKRILTPVSYPAFDSKYVQRNGFNIGYHQSKWVADQLVLESSQRGLPVSVFRLSLISGDSSNGTWNINDYICRLISGCCEMGIAPEQDLYFDFCPVDYLSKAIVYIALKKQKYGTAFMLKNSKPIKWNDFIEKISSHGFSINLVPANVWIEKLKLHLKRNQDSTLNSLLPLFEIRPTERLIIATPSFVKSAEMLEKRTTGRMLADSGIKCPEVDDKLISTYLTFLAERGIVK